MPFKKNNKLGGRTPGAKSNKTKQWEELSKFILDAGSEKLIAELMKLEGKEYVQAFSSLLGYFKPRLKHIESTGELEVSQPIIKIIKTYDNTSPEIA